MSGKNTTSMKSIRKWFFALWIATIADLLYLRDQLVPGYDEASSDHPESHYRS